MRHVSCAALASFWLFAGSSAGYAQSPSQQAPSQQAPGVSKPRPAPTPTPSADPVKQERERDLAKASEPMKFQRVRLASPACGTECPEWISAEGRIMAGSTAAQFRRIVSSVGEKKIPIFIHSAGGAVEEAYAMGRLIRSKGLSVSVTKTEVRECGPSDKDCKALQAKGIKYANPKPNLSVCASSCVFVLAGGVQRHVGPLSLVGVHQFESRVTHVQVLQRYRMVPNPKTGELMKEVISEERVSQKTVKTRTKSEVYDKTFKYFTELGVAAEPIMAALTTTPHDSMHWMSPSEITTTRIATDRKTGTQMLSYVPVSTSINPVATQPVPAAPTVNPDLVRAIQEQLKSANCLAGGVVSVWGARSTRAVEKFAASANVSLDAKLPSPQMLSAIRGSNKPNLCDTPVF